MQMSVIIVAYKSGEILKNCMNSIAKYNDLGDELEVIVVDNSPDDARIESIISESDLKEFMYIPANNNGFGAGNNIGARAAKGEVLAFINPDIILIEPVFKKIYEHFCDNNNLCLMGAKLLYDNMNPGFSFYYDYKMSVLKKWTLKLWNRLDTFDSNQMYLAGADMFVRREAFEKAGMFDEKIFMYYEEPDLIRRIRTAIPDAEIAYDPTLKMIHLEKKSTPSSLAMIGHEMNSAIYYGKKYGLDYRRKIRFEYHYYELKMLVYRIFSKSKADSIAEIMKYIEENYLQC